MRSLRLALPLLAALGLSACGNLNQTQQRTATGALAGGAAGGLIGSFSGDTGLGALLGAGAGGLGGYLYDQSQQRYEPRRAPYRGRDDRGRGSDRRDWR
ncbi:glycine zipper domain-containing protein [Falsiroseomonas selenitidurans]|uniref:Glycine zipper domain-containing protein n=1 Tax=Falsiroseomonas selenitidurans TaxID=2716335 RepID=A0ABX1DX67_9PROT|nr:glycine zipper domain-containing protein [Falsiroseomonas selenitidurans]NKC29371.1 hypothetical protein [Falsiroseomonas selenitidurans]